MTTIKKRDEYTTIKVFATVLVVVGHIAKFYYPGGGVFPVSPNAIIGGIAEVIYAFHMPLFMFLSGAIYSYNVNQMGKYRDGKKFILNKFKRLMIPYFCWAVGYVTPVVVLLGITELSAREYIVRCFLGGDSRHLWYLWTLFWIFCLCAFIRFFEPPRRLILFIIIVGIIVCAYFYTKLTPLWNILYYGFFFLIGYIFDIYKEKADSFFVKYGWIFVIFSPSLLLTVFMRTSLFLDVILAVEGIALSYWLIRKFDAKKGKLYNYLVKDSFGIYLVHPMLIYVAFYYCEGISTNPYIFCIILLIVVILISCGIVDILRKINCGILLGE